METVLNLITCVCDIYTKINNKQITECVCLLNKYEPVLTIWVPTRSDTENVRGRKFQIWKIEELYYPCSKNKCADQLRSYCEADLRLCFRLSMQIVGFPVGRLIYAYLGKFLDDKIPRRSKDQLYNNLAFPTQENPCNSYVPSLPSHLRGIICLCYRHEDVVFAMPKPDIADLGL